MRKHPDRLVFIDETSVKTNLTRQYGRSLCGKRLEMDAPFGAWGTQTFIAGLKHDNLIAPWVIKGAMDGEAFEAYVRNVLAPELQPGTVVICDNLATHYNRCGCNFARSWVLVPLSAAIFARPQSYRNGILKTQSTPAQNWGKNIRPDVRRTYRNLRSLHS